jgi:hypothetical protein
LIVSDVFSDAKYQPSFGLESLETAMSMSLIVAPDAPYCMITM